MKTLMLRSCGNNFGPGYTFKPEDLNLAEHEGELAEDEAAPRKIFHGPLAGQIQSALAYMRGLDFFPQVMPVIFGLGNQDSYRVLTNQSFMAAITSCTCLEATFLAHPDEVIVEWSRLAREAAKQMFNLMDEDDIAAGFFLSPFIELASSACGVEASGVVGWDELAPMEGLKFVQKDGQDILVAGKVARATGAGVVLTPAYLI